MKKILIVITTIFAILSGSINIVSANDNKVIAIYFYSSTCSSCQKLTSLYNSLEDKHKDFILKKYNITDLKNESLLSKYNKAYKVGEDDEGIVPVVFIKNTYLTGQKNIKDNLENLILKNDGINTMEIQDMSENHVTDIKQFMNFKTLSVFLAGLVGGLNPCSLSMLLFFISLIMVRKVNILKIGIAFIIGKFLAYLLLGTVFFGLLSKLNIGWLHITIKIIMLIVILILIVLNLQDFFSAKNEKYNKIRVQLPTVLRKFNHTIIKKISNTVNLKLILLISFALGMLISLGEFLCTGQIYLTTIVTILQTNTTLNLQAFIYLIIYDLAFVIPLLILVFAIYKGKEVFEVSEAIREKLHWIKLINVVIFLVFAVIVILLF